MYKYMIIILLTLTTSLSTTLNTQETDNTHAVKIRICTYNIRRMGKEKNSVYQWTERKQAVIDTILAINPDVIGLQEVVKTQLLDIKNGLPTYQSFGKSRGSQTKHLFQKLIMKHPDAINEYNPISYNTSTTQLIDHGCFGINPRNHILPAVLPRICTWGHFKNKATNEEFYVYNTHLDKSSKTIQTKQIKKILKHINKHAQGKSVIVMGDFNSTLTISAQKNLFSDNNFNNTEISFDPQNYNAYTRTGWKENREFKKIDHLLIRSTEYNVDNHTIVNHPDDAIVSDHRPVYIDIALKQAP